MKTRPSRRAFLAGVASLALRGATCTDPLRPYRGYGSITALEAQANTIYNSRFRPNVKCED